MILTPVKFFGIMENLTFKRRVDSTRNMIIHSEFYQKFKCILQKELTVLKELKEDETILITRMISFGLGKVSSAVISMHQLLFFNNISKYFGMENVSAYDPLFDKNDWSFLNALGIENEEKFPFSICDNDQVIFIFMPHCEWSVNKEIITYIIDNNLMVFLYCNRLTVHQKDELNISLVKDIYIKGEYSRSDVFNDCSLYIFNQLESFAVPDS